jgi:two-component system, cell cycle sensor histidine kinase and response regulator CckA
MWRNPSAVSLAAVRRRVPAVAIAFAIVTALAAVDATSGPDTVILGTLTAGPGIAAAAGRPRRVVAVGAYALALITVLCWRPDRIWGTDRHLLFSLVAVGMTAIGVGIAVQIRAAQRALVLAENHWRTLAAVVTHSDDAIVAVSLEGRLTAFNAGAERLYGARAEDVVGTSVAAFSESAIPTPRSARPRPRS